jgi:two-component system LytT family response regulator
MKKIILIDDEPLARSIVRQYLQAMPDFEIVAECDNGFEGFKAIQQHQPDVIILDVQMPKINGFEMLELIEQRPAVIFATAFDEFAIKAFENNAVDYLLKPFSAERFQAALKKSLQRGAEQHASVSNLLQDKDKTAEILPHIVVRNQGEISIIPLEQIQYMEAFDDYVKIFTADSYYLKKQTLSYYEAQLDASKFFRIHRSYILRLAELSRIEPMEKNTYLAILKNGKKLPISRSAYSDLKTKLGI